MKFNYKVNAIQKNNKLYFCLDNNKYSINIKTKEISLTKSTDDIIYYLVFEMNKTSQAKIELINENNYFYINILTLNLDIKDNLIYVKYKIIDSNSNYELKIVLEE